MGAVDHIIVATRDLDAAAQRMATVHGLDSVAGGVHPAYGTANRIIPVGGGAYLELMAVDDPEAAAEGILGAWITSLTGEGDRLATWMVAPDDFDATVERLDLDVAPGGRRLPDGSEVSWRLAGLVAALTEPPLPAFIAWDQGGGPHPSATPLTHRCTPKGVTWIELAGDRARLERWLGDELGGVEIRHVDSRPGLRAVGIACTAGPDIVVR